MKMKYTNKIRLIFSILLLSFSTSIIAFTECPFELRQVWLGFDVRNVWVCFKGKDCIYKEKSSTVSDDQLNSMYSSAMAAITANKGWFVRFPEDNYDRSLQSSRNDFTGFWYMK